MKKQHTQQIKDRATILQTHLKQAGIELARTVALNVMAKVDGYRSFTAAHHGKHHSVGVFVQARRKHRTLKDGASREDAVSDYLTDGGQHCLGCGSARVVDENESSADHRHWEILMGCQDCDERWWAVYELDTRDGFDLRTPHALEALKQESCPYCKDHDSGLDYGDFRSGRQGYQHVGCKGCGSHWVDIYRLADAAEPEFAL